MHCSICGKAYHKKGHYKYVETGKVEEEEVVQQEEVGTDCDDPSVMHNIIYQTIDPTRYPTHVVDYGLQIVPRGKLFMNFP
jgi:hypothetical protein